MQQNLQIDKLKYFDVDQVQHVKNYNVAAGVTEWANQLNEGTEKHIFCNKYLQGLPGIRNQKSEASVFQWSYEWCTLFIRFSSARIQIIQINFY